MRMTARAKDDDAWKGGTERGYDGGLVARRALVVTGLAGLLLPVAGCSGRTSAPGPSGRPAAPSGQPDGAPGKPDGAPGKPAGSDPAVAARLAGLERRFGARLGVYARDTGSGATVAYQADERFPMCSTFKVLAAAAILHRDNRADLGKRVRYSRADLIPASPVTAAHLATGLTVEQLCQAAVSDSDSTAANLLVAELGGPAAVTGYARSLADHVTRLDRTEPTLNEGTPGDDRDTSSPAALAADYAAIVTGTALPPRARALITRWLVGSVTGAGRIRAAVPAGWTVGDKSGTGGYGTDNDIAVLWPPKRSPIVLAIMSTRSTQTAPPSDALVAQATRVVLPALRPPRS
jgi:beta-lactamase class A